MLRVQLDSRHGMGGMIPSALCLTVVGDSFYEVLGIVVLAYEIYYH